MNFNMFRKRERVYYIVIILLYIIIFMPDFLLSDNIRYYLRDVFIILEFVRICVFYNYFIFMRNNLEGHINLVKSMNNLDSKDEYYECKYHILKTMIIVCISSTLSLIVKVLCILYLDIFDYFPSVIPILIGSIIVIWKMINEIRYIIPIIRRIKKYISDEENKNENDK